MTTKQEYEAFLHQINIIETSVLDLDDALIGADNRGDIEQDIGNLVISVHNIQAWLNTQIARTAQEEQNAVMNNFLAELKVVFDKYAASISTASFEDGYGIGYGEPGTGFILTATLDNVTSTKEIRKAVIVSGDLV